MTLVPGLFPTRVTTTVALIAAIVSGCSSEARREPGQPDGGGQPTAATGGSSEAGTTGNAGEAAAGGENGSIAEGGTTGGDAGVDSGAPSEGGSPVPGQPPPLAEDGISPYQVECRGDSWDCGHQDLRCVEIRMESSSPGFVCSNQCETADDCTPSPPGVPESDCIQFTHARRCLLACQVGQTFFDCPGGMTCFTYPGTDFGYCLWL